MIDTGAQLSVIPKTNQSKITQRKLFAANGSIINTYGEKRLSLALNLRREFIWTFIVADISDAIIGADFLNHHNLLVDIKGKKLIDGNTRLETNGTTINRSIMSIKDLRPAEPYASLIDEFPNITLSVNNINQATKKAIHFITTSGPPVFAKARQLSVEKLRAAKVEFDFLLKSGIARPLKSPWSSPIHVTSKKDGTWRICGDYRFLNSKTVKDRYPLPFISDIANLLHGKTIFSSIDLKRASKS